MPRDLSWAANAQEELFTGPVAKRSPSVSDSIHVAQGVIDTEGLAFANGASFCLALQSKYFDRSDWGTVTPDLRTKYFSERKGLCILGQNRAAIPGFIAFPPKDVWSIISEVQRDLGLPEFEFKRTTKREFLALSPKLDAPGGAEWQFGIEATLDYKPTIDGRLLQWTSGALELDMPLSWALARIRWQIAEINCPATPAEVMAIINEVLGTVLVFYERSNG